MKKHILLSTACAIIALTTVVACKTRQALVNQQWRLTEIAGETAPETSEAFIIFADSADRVSGNGGCNTFAGAYTLSGADGISFSRMLFTRKMCLGVDTEGKFIEALNNTASYSVSGNTLTLYDAAKSKLATFVKK